MYCKPHIILIISTVITLFTSGVGPLNAQSIREQMFSYLDKYSRTDQLIKGSKLDNVVVDTTNLSIRIYISGGFKEQFFTDEVVESIYGRVRTFVPDSLSTYKLEIITDNRPIEQLVPNAIRKGEKDGARIWKADYKGEPWVKNNNTPLFAPLGLEGHHLAVWQSHGTYWKQEKKDWLWQRPHLFCTTEDLFTQTFVIPYIMPMLENAGAIVYTPRDRNWQNHEVIIDNDAPTKNGTYHEEGHWHVTDIAGFAHLKDVYYHYDHPFSDGTARYANTSKSNNPQSVITWNPSIPEDGSYAVYVAYQTLPNSVSDATYTVVHRGVRTEFKVNQRMGGSTWVYLGTFPFAKDDPERNHVELSNKSNQEGVVTADAVRFGSGMGNIARGTVTSADNSQWNHTTSHMPRWAEASLYYAQWTGMPDSVYNHFRSDHDYNNDMWARCETVNNLAGNSPYIPYREGRNVPIELAMAFHSDAGFSRNGDIIGTLAICTALSEFYDGLTNAGISRMASYDLASLILSNLSIDMKAYNWQLRQVWNRNYCETREPQVPSIILEMLSHQNFDDMCYGYDPKFKFDFCRSVYKTVVKYIATMHQRDYVIQPLPVHNFAITLNDQSKWANLTWEPTTDPLEPSATPRQYVVYTRIDEGDFDNGRIVDGTSFIAQLEQGHLYSFRICAMNDGGISFPSETLCAYAAPKNEGTILIVNGFTRLEGPKQINTATEQGFDLDADPGVQYGSFAGFCGRQITFDKTNMGSETSNGTGYSGRELEGKIIMGNTFDYVSLHGQGIQQLAKHSFCSCSEEALVNKIIVPREYQMIDLIFGVQKEFNPATLSILNDYCQQGGRLLISGANIMSSQSFSMPSLHARYGAEVKEKEIDSINGSNLDFTIYREMNDKSYAVPVVMSLTPTDNAFAMLQYSNNLPAAIAYDGTDHKAVTVGFPIESIKDKNKRNLLMQAITNFLCR